MTSSNDIHKFKCDTAGWNLSQSAATSNSHFNVLRVCVPSLFNDSCSGAAGWRRKIWFYSHSSRRAFEMCSFHHIYYLEILLYFISAFYEPPSLHSLGCICLYGKAQERETMMTTMAMTEKRINTLYANSHISWKGKFFTYLSLFYLLPLRLWWRKNLFLVYWGMNRFLCLFCPCKKCFSSLNSYVKWISSSDGIFKHVSYFFLNIQFKVFFSHYASFAPISFIFK